MVFLVFLSPIHLPSILVTTHYWFKYSGFIYVLKFGIVRPFFFLFFFFEVVFAIFEHFSLP